MNYSDTLRRGWAITWQNKWLWLLAVLPMLFSMANVFLTSSNNQLLIDPAVMTPEAAAAYAGRAVLFSCLSLLSLLVITVLGFITRGGMITGVARLERGEATGFSRSFNEGWRRVLPLAGMTIALYALPVILFIGGTMAMFVPLTLGLMSGSSGQDELMAGLGTMGILFVCCLAAGYMVVMLLLSFVYPFAFRGIMLRRMGVIESLRHAWRVLRQNVGEIILLALPFALVYLLIFAIFAAFYFAIALGDIQNAMMGGMVGATDWRFLLAFLFYGLFGAVLSAWQSATFTLGYLHWTGKDVLA